MKQENNSHRVTDDTENRTGNNEKLGRREACRETTANSVETVDRALEACQTSERRAVLRHLITTDASHVSVDELVEVVQTERRMDRGEVAVMLRHRHLPYLEHCDVITYEHEEGRVSYTPNPLVRRVLGSVQDDASGSSS